MLLSIFCDTSHLSGEITRHGHNSHYLSLDPTCRMLRSKCGCGCPRFVFKLTAVFTFKLCTACWCVWKRGHMPTSRHSFLFHQIGVHRSPLKDGHCALIQPITCKAVSRILTLSTHLIASSEHKLCNSHKRQGTMGGL